ncbi:hypothetical protein B0H14DRAFT_2852537, partial [Mycena olivaceomarginata]
DRGAVHELEGGSARRGWERAGCKTDTHTTVCRPNTGSRDRGCRARARGWERERTGCGTDACAAVSSRCSETVRALARHSGAQILQCRAARVPFPACTLDVFAGRVRRTPQSRNGAGAPGTSASTLHGSAQMRRRWDAAPTTAASQGAARSACGDIHHIWGSASGAPEKARVHE